LNVGRHTNSYILPKLTFQVIKMFVTTLRTTIDRMFKSTTFVRARSFTSSTPKKIFEFLNTAPEEHSRNTLTLQILGFYTSLFPAYCLFRWIYAAPTPPIKPTPAMKIQAEVSDDSLSVNSDNFAEFLSSDENLEKLLSDENLEKFLRNI
jgi:hypothetical protein